MGFDIGLIYSNRCNKLVETLLEEARQRWLEVVLDGYEPSEWNGRYYDALEISIDLKELDGDAGRLAEALNYAEHPDTGRPISGFLRLDSRDFKTAKQDWALWSDVALHEMGHVIGMNLYVWRATGLFKDIGNGQAVLRGPNCGKVCGEIFGTEPMDVPLYKTDGNQHIDEASFPNEIMSPVIGGGGNALSRLTVSILDDFGYQVDYDAAETHLKTFSTSPHRHRCHIPKRELSV